jgi:hypothetical protein
MLTGDGGGGRAGRGGAREVLTGDGGVAMRWRTGGNEWRRLALIASVEEGAKKLERQGMRCGEGQGGVMTTLMALMPLKTGARLRGGLTGGNDGGVSNGSGGIRG